MSSKKTEYWLFQHPKLHLSCNSHEMQERLQEQKKKQELEESKIKAKKLEQLFNYKLKTFEVEEIKLSQNRELKSKLRRAKSIPEVNLWAIKIMDDYLNSE